MSALNFRDSSLEESNSAIGDLFTLIFLFEFSQAGFEYTEYDVLFEILPMKHELNSPSEFKSTFIDFYPMDVPGNQVIHKTSNHFINI